MLHRPGQGSAHIGRSFAKFGRFLPVVGLSVAIWLVLWATTGWMAGGL